MKKKMINDIKISIPFFDRFLLLCTSFNRLLNTLIRSSFVIVNARSANSIASSLKLIIQIIEKNIKYHTIEHVFSLKLLIDIDSLILIVLI